jgi:FAD-linked sulfhydryl oxidase
MPATVKAVVAASLCCVAKSPGSRDLPSLETSAAAARESWRWCCGETPRGPRPCPLKGPGAPSPVVQGQRPRAPRLRWKRARPLLVRLRTRPWAQLEAPPQPSTLHLQRCRPAVDADRGAPAALHAPAHRPHPACPPTLTSSMWPCLLGEHEAAPLGLHLRTSPALGRATAPHKHKCVLVGWSWMTVNRPCLSHHMIQGDQVGPPYIFYERSTSCVFVKTQRAGMLRAAGAAISFSTAALLIAFRESRQWTARADGEPSARDGASSRVAFEPCPEVACKGSEKVAAFLGEASPRRRLRAAAAPGPGPAGGGPSGSQSTVPGAAASTGGNVEDEGKEECPPNREELGRSTWTYLHATVAYYPAEPVAEDREAALGMIQSLARLYPCLHCRAEFAEHVARHPPAVGSRADLSLWLCDAHNRVNKVLGKAPFPCTDISLQERWRKGPPAGRTCGGRQVRTNEGGDDAEGSLQ